jgi:glutaminyl-peptide cyclotransferase
MNRIHTILALAAVTILAGCGSANNTPAANPIQPFDPGALDGSAALEAVRKFVALGPRDSGTPGALKAAEYLRDQLRNAGIQADIDSFEDQTVRGPITYHNVIGRLPGNGKNILLLGSHFDTKIGMAPAFEGANDSGSSTGLLLEMARVMAMQENTGADLWFVFFDGEECWKRYGTRDGLHGSRHMAEQLVREGLRNRVRAVIILDMIGDKDLTVTLPRNSTPELTAMVFDAARAEKARSHFSLYGLEVGDDHVPFMEAGMPAIDLIDFEYGSAPGRNDYWHTPEDTMDKLSAESLQIVGRVTLRLVNDLNAASAVP